MQSWKLFWITIFYSLSQQMHFGCCRRTHRSNDYLNKGETEEVRNVTPSSSQGMKLIVAEATLPSPNSQTTQEMARTFSSSPLSKYWNSKSKISQYPQSDVNYSYKKPKSKFRPTYTNRRKSSLSNSKNTTKNYDDFLVTYYKQLTKSVLLPTPTSSPGFLSQLYSFFTDEFPDPNVLKRTDLDDYVMGGDDGNSADPEAESRTGLVLATTMGLMQAFVAFTTSIGLGGFILMVLTFLVTLVVKGILFAMITVYFM